MNIELTEEVNVEMYMVECRTGEITPIDVVRQSDSGDTVETASGKRLRTNCQSHKIFYDYGYALIESKQAVGKIDAEYHFLLKQQELRLQKRAT